MKYIFQPERNAGTAESTNFVFCDPNQAEIWALYADGGGGTALMGDIPVAKFDRLLATAFAQMSVSRAQADDKPVAVLAVALKGLLAAVESAKAGSIGLSGQTVCRAVNSARAALNDIDNIDD